MQFRVRLKGFNFMAHVPADFATGEVLDQEPVPAEWLEPAKGSDPVPCTWLLVEARSAKDAQDAFKTAHKIDRVAAPFVVEALAAALTPAPAPAPVT